MEALSLSAGSESRRADQAVGAIEAALSVAIAGQTSERFRREVVRRIREAVADLHEQADRAEAEMVRLRVEAGRLQGWVARERGVASCGATVARGPRAA